MKTKKRSLLYIAPVGYWGGVEKFLSIIWKEHRKRGESFHIIFFNNGPFYDWAKSNFDNVKLLENTFKLRNPLLVLKACIEIRTYLKKYSIKVAHLSMPYSQIIFFLASIGLRVRKVWFQHGPVGSNWDYFASMFTYADIILVNSDFTQSRHLKLPFSHTHKIKKIYLPIEVDKNYSHESQNKMILCVAGRITSWKGHDLALMAIRKLKDKSENVCLKIAGKANSEEDKQYLNQLKQYIVQNKLENHVEFLGHVNNMVDVYKQISVLLHCSITPEPFGLVVAEAMAHKVPVIASDSGGVAEVAIDKVTCLTFNSIDKKVDELVENIQNLKANPGAFVENAYEHILDNYSVESSFDHLDQVYSDLLNKI